MHSPFPLPQRGEGGWGVRGPFPALPRVPVVHLAVLDQLLPVEEDVNDVAHDADVLQRIAVDHNDVGHFPGLDRTQPVGIDGAMKSTFERSTGTSR